MVLSFNFFPFHATLTSTLSTQLFWKKEKRWKTQTLLLFTTFNFNCTFSTVNVYLTLFLRNKILFYFCYSCYISDTSWWFSTIKLFNKKSFILFLWFFLFGGFLAFKCCWICLSVRLSFLIIRFLENFICRQFHSASSYLTTTYYFVYFSSYLFLGDIL